MGDHTLTVILTSSVVAGVIGALVSGIFGLWSKGAEYANDYYKIVVRRRVEAYEELEGLIRPFKTSLMDKDRRPYHFAFSSENPSLDLHAAMFRVQARGLWISERAFEASRRLNLLLFDLPMDPDDCVRFGKDHYVEIAELRSDLERAVAHDALYIHKVPKFLRAKKREVSEFSQVQLGPRRRPSAPDGAAP